jgi:lysophospholipase L1-like esterase
VGVPPTTTTTTTTTTPSSGYYVSLGDSYAAGAPGDGGNNVGGYATQVVTDVAPNHDLILENFGCGGATTTSLMSVIGCPDGGEPPDGVPYQTMTQLAAAISFIDAHRGQIGLITITIGGNDLGGGIPYASIAANIAKISAQLRAAAGKSVPIIGLSYPDLNLADWLSGPSGVAIAEQSVTTIRQILYPAWKAAYASSNAAFVDIAAASGAYTPFTQLVNDPTYGEIPYAVSQICILTGNCANNVHPTAAGYTLIAQQIVLAYLKLVS